jgi:KaiC/GvpD/RAD55 family RecA-like ATPase
VPTGFTDLDRMTSGLQPGDLVIVAGRPSMGKTSLALNMAEHVALETGMPVGVFSMEMGASQLVMRMLGSVGKLDQHKVRTGRLADEDWRKLTDAVGRLNDAPIHIDETAALNALELRARARRLHRQYGKLGLIVVDYLQLMSASSQGENRATEISEISRGLKALAKELNVPVVALSQLNRSLEQRPNKRPVMSDLRESGAIEQDADLILFIYRDEVYNQDSPDKGKAEVIIGKQRNGPYRNRDPGLSGRIHPLREFRRSRPVLTTASPRSDGGILVREIPHEFARGLGKLDIHFFLPVDGQQFDPRVPVLRILVDLELQQAQCVLGATQRDEPIHVGKHRARIVEGLIHFVHDFVRQTIDIRRGSRLALQLMIDLLQAAAHPVVLVPIRCSRRRRRILPRPFERVVPQ